MGQRLEFDQILRDLMPDGKKNVYFQAPPADKMQYPCILYSRSDVNEKFADNKLYSHTKRYQVTYIDRNPDSETIDKIAQLPLTSYNRFFVSDNLNHDIFTTYF